MVTSTTGEKKGFVTVSRRSDTPGQTVNVDLCFVPAQHAPDQKLPAVSGSSGRLVVERTHASCRQPWSGEVFADPTCPYEDAMRAFVTAANTRYAWRERPQSADASPIRVQQRQLRQQAADVQTRRRAVRAQRQQEDVAWQARCDERRHTQEVIRRDGISNYPTYRAQEQQWRALRQQRQATLAQRHQDDLQWRQERLQLRHALADVPIVRTWRAILMVTDNCTRACYGLPLFSDGPKVTSEQVSTALTSALPPAVSFLISDRGTHFTAHSFATFAHEHGFMHVPISRHRPQTNGIAERCVRTLKEWLRQQAWTSDQELVALLDQFVAEYNERPHQGLGIPGLSPNEFAKRVWLF